MALIHPNDVVSKFPYSGVTDSCRSCLELSVMTRWAQVGSESSGMVGGCCGWPRYICHIAFVLLTLTRCVSS